MGSKTIVTCDNDECMKSEDMKKSFQNNWVRLSLPVDEFTQEHFIFCSVACLVDYCNKYELNREEDLNTLTRYKLKILIDAIDQDNLVVVNKFIDLLVGIKNEDEVKECSQLDDHDEVLYGFEEDKED